MRGLPPFKNLVLSKFGNDQAKTLVTLVKICAVRRPTTNGLAQLAALNTAHLRRTHGKAAKRIDSNILPHFKPNRATPQEITCYKSAGRVSLHRTLAPAPMSKDGEKDLLSELVEGAGDVVHLPYTPEFEKICSEIKPNPSVHDKHQIWERLLQRAQSAHPPSQIPPPVSHEPAKEPEPRTSENELPSTDEGAATLFPDNGPAPAEQSVQVKQPWTLPKEAELSPELQEERDQFLADVANSRLGKMEQRVAFLLARFPETRDSDIKLCLRYWRKFQAEVIERWQPLELEILFDLDKIESISRIRRHIQNDLYLYRGMESLQFRANRQMELHEYLAAHKSTVPEIRFYLDETGNEGEKAYTGVAGICVINWQQYEKHSAALDQWRREQNWPETIHFADISPKLELRDKHDRAVQLLAQLEKRRAGLLFAGYALSFRGRTYEGLSSLFIQLIIDALRNLEQTGCLVEPRSLLVVKESEPGFDSMYLDTMNIQLSKLVALQFPGKVFAQPIQSKVKGREVLLECADLIAGGMQRRALYKGRNPKDTLAEAAFNVTGFEDDTDNGAIFKIYPQA